jgi:hypothetical protein
MRTVAYNKLNTFYKRIVDSLQAELGYSFDSAMSLTEEYMPVLQLLELYYGPSDYAAKMHEAKRIGWTPELWVARIKRLEESFKHESPKFPRRKAVLVNGLAR